MPVNGKKPLPAYMEYHLAEMSKKLSAKPALLKLYRSCFADCWQNAMAPQEDGTVFLYTGDIPAMWNRDATQEVMPYLCLAKESAHAAGLIKGTVRREIRYLLTDSYANSFNLEPTGHHYADTDTPLCGDWVWEEKYETDTLCWPFRLAFLYYRETGDASVFDDSLREAARKIIDQFIVEQHHEERSRYTHSRINTRWEDTLQNDGRGYPVKYTGMVWQGFTPSDNACILHYNIPGNFFAAAILRELLRLEPELGILGAEYAVKAARLKEEILHGIELFGTCLHPKYGRIYAYETDGFGNHVLMDDANVPNLLSMPYLEADTDPEIYANTRRFILSRDNPWFCEGRYAKGLGSPHTPGGYVWPFGLSMFGLTCSDREAALEALDMLTATDAGTGQMHESFDPDCPEKYTREWFTASNSMFCEFVQLCVRSGWLEGDED